MLKTKIRLYLISVACFCGAAGFADALWAVDPDEVEQPIGKGKIIQSTGKPFVGVDVVTQAASSTEVNEEYDDEGYSEEDISDEEDFQPDNFDTVLTWEETFGIWVNQGAGVFILPSRPTEGLEYTWSFRDGLRLQWPRSDLDAEHEGFVRDVFGRIINGWTERFPSVSGRMHYILSLLKFLDRGGWGIDFSVQNLRVLAPFQMGMSIETYLGWQRRLAWQRSVVQGQLDLDRTTQLSREDPEAFVASLTELGDSFLESAVALSQLAVRRMDDALLTRGLSNGAGLLAHVGEAIQSLVLSIKNNRRFSPVQFVMVILIAREALDALLQSFNRSYVEIYDNLDERRQRLMNARSANKRTAREKHQRSESPEEGTKRQRRQKPQAQVEPANEQEMLRELANILNRRAGERCAYDGGFFK